jgi:hypothetical protein
MMNELEASQVQIGTHTLDIYVGPEHRGQHLVQLRLPGKGKDRGAFLTMQEGWVPTRAEVPGWIESVAGAVRAKLDSAERAAQLRRGYRV